LCIIYQYFKYAYVADDVWGVIDSRLQSNFPDLRNRSTIHSHNGTCIVVPREGDTIRLYIQLPAVERGNTKERIDRAKMTKEMLMEAARKTFAPYKLDWPNIEWWTIYITGQRYASNFADKDALVFIAGDACHTHSPKAGQGMNASMNDTHNLAWKLALVIKGLAYPDILKTYEFERRNYAKQLIEFDRKFAKLFADKPAQTAEEAGVTHEEFLDAFQTFGGFTSGIAIQYGPSLVTAHSLENQALAEGLPIGRSFSSQIVVRHADARPFHLHDQMPSDLRFRVLIFAGDCLDPSQLKKIQETAVALETLAKRFTPASAAYDDVIDFITISSIAHHTYEKESLPFFFYQNRWKVFCDEVASDKVCIPFSVLLFLRRVKVREITTI
jgi:phenol 2-monooxygenase